MYNKVEKVDADRFYTVNKTSKILGLSVGEVQKLMRDGLFQTDDNLGVYKRVLGKSILDYLLVEGDDDSEIVESGIKDEFSFYSNMKVEMLTKRFYVKLNGESNGYRKRKKWYHAYSGI